MINMAYRRWLISIERTSAVVVIGSTALVVYNVLAYLFVLKWQYGIRGIAIAMFGYGVTYQISAYITIKCFLTELKDV